MGFGFRRRQCSLIRCVAAVAGGGVGVMEVFCTILVPVMVGFRVPKGVEHKHGNLTHKKTRGHIVEQKRCIPSGGHSIPDSMLAT